MKLLPAQTDDAALSRFGEEASSMLMRGDFAALAKRFGYALAYEREPAVALAEDYAKAAALPIHSAHGESVSVAVKYFKPDDTALFALVECTVPLSDNRAVLLELIVRNSGRERHIMVEDISGALS
jgi:hypothetical protein